ncbi:MAG: putative DNA binding domain-containing protein, partial [Bacteroidia bacterium]|nr:putative DNA binding domain-containing protein [Bacteroidia bacterium]
YGGTILIGVEDDGKISGIKEKKMEEWINNIARHNIIPSIIPEISIRKILDLYVAVIIIPKGRNKPYQTIDGKYIIRVGSTNRIASKEELCRLFQQAGLVRFDISYVERTGFDSLDISKLHTYFETYYEMDFINLETSEQRKILLNTDILLEEEGRIRASVGGLLIFGKNTQRFLPQSSVVFAVFNGDAVTDDLIDKKELTGTLPEIIDNTTSLIQVFIPKPSKISGLKRKEKIAIPVKVIREIIVNAVSHRDYSIINRKISVYIFSSRIEITSPGKIPNTLTIEKIKYGYSAPRNMFLIKYLDNMRYIDGLGRGIPNMLKEMKENIRFEEIGEDFKIIVNYM